MPTVAGPNPFEQAQWDSTSDSSMVAPTTRFRQKSTSTPPPAAEPRYREKGKQRATHLHSLSIESATSTPPAEHDSQTNSYFLHVPSSTSNNDVTPTAASMKSPPRPPARSPLRQSQQLSPRQRASEIPTPPVEVVVLPEYSIPIPRTGKDNSDAARTRRREAYKSGMSFVSLYELYSDPPPPMPVPPVPTLDRSRFTADTGSVRRARSGSTTSVGGSRERKGSTLGNTAPAGTRSLHTRDRSGSTSGSQLNPNRAPAVGDAGGPMDSPMLKGLASATMSSTITPMSSNHSNLSDPISKSKRQHVLFELLETERIYSSDMALVKAVHLPLALGMKIDFGPMGSVTSPRSSTEHPAETGPSRSSGVSTNTASSNQSQSGSSGPAVPYGAINEPPMSVDDTKVIFANLDELAEFSGRFTEFIQLALGAEIDGGEGPDKVGELFLQMLPIMQPLYETYITKHSASISRLTALTTENPTPAMMNYIEHTKSIASTHSNSWDINSLLIKPIQRFLKYPLLLDTLLNSTSDTHPDKAALLQAKNAMVDASRFVNEQTQKVEICRTILQRKPLRGLSAVFSSTNAQSTSQLKVKGSKSVFAVTKTKDAPPGTTPSPAVTPFDAAFDPIQLENRIAENASGGAAGLEELIKHLQGFEAVLPLYMRDVVNWVRAVRETMTRLEKWATAFEKVISLDEVSGIEALDAFRGVLGDRLSPMLDGLETAVRTTLVPTLAKIQDTMKGPTLLLNTAASLRTVHNQLMNTPYTSKNNRPSPQIVEGSKTYLALMQQLRTDLPVYVRHLDKMFGFVVLQVAKWQERWYREVGNAWGDLWKALEVGPGSRKEYRIRRGKEISNNKKAGKKPEGPLDDPRRGAYGCSGDETVAIWWDRWEEINSTISVLGVPSGAALQGVRSLQGLIKSPLSAFIAGVNSPLPAPSPSRSIPFEGYAIEEEIEFARPDDDDEYLPPGYYPNKPSKSHANSRQQIQTQTSTTSSNSHRSNMSPTQTHSLNNLLPPVSPGPVKREKPPLKTRTVSFPKSQIPPSPLGEREPSSAEIYSTTSATHSRDWTIRSRAQSQERVPRHKKSDPLHLSKGRSPRHNEGPGSPEFDPDVNVNGSRTMPRGSSFRKRLSENMWFGETSNKKTETNGSPGGLEIDVEELEAAAATTVAREEREAELADMGQRMRAISNGSASLHRHQSNSSNRDVLHKRRTSDANEVSTSTARRQHGSVSSTSRRQRPSVDLPRQVVSEYRQNPASSSPHDPILFTCTVVASFEPRQLRYLGLPFLTLEVGDIVNITKDAGRPSQHPNLEAVVTDGVDTLFVGTKLPDSSDSVPEVGWLWASFVMPFES